MHIYYAGLMMSGMEMTGMKILKNTVAHSALGTGVLVMSAYGANAETMSEALASAYTTNPTLQSARASVRATDEGKAQALSGFRPSVSAAGTTSTKQLETSADRGNTIHTNPRTLTLSVNQSLFAGGQTMAAVSAAEHSISAARARLKSSEQSVLLNAATVYLDVLRDQAVLDLNIKNEQVLNRHLEATRDRFEVGEITRTDVHQAEARLAGATANRIQSEGTLEASRASYTNVIGTPAQVLEKPTMTLPLPTALDDALNLADEENPAIIAAVYDEKAALDSVDSSKGGLLPTLDLSGSANRSFDTSSSSSDYWSNSMEAKVTLTVPLYQSGSAYSKLRQARQQAAASRLDAEQARRDVGTQVRQAWQNLEVTQARIDSIETQVRAAETALEGVQREASVGSRTVLDVLDSEQELLDARVNLVKSQRDETVAALTLLSSVGRLTAADLNLAVDLYDTDMHYRNVRNKWFGAN